MKENFRLHERVAELEETVKRLRKRLRKLEGE